MNPESNSEISALRNQVFILLVALIVVSGTFTVFMFRQASLLGKDVDANMKIVNSVNQGQGAVSNLANQLGAYSVTHADIRPVLAKYGIIPAPTQPVPGTPAPAAPAAPKK
jgi:hypothetical protein